MLLEGRAAKLSLLNFLSLFRDLQKWTRFGGGGVVAACFRVLQKPTRFSGGGGSGRILFSVLRDQTTFGGGEGGGSNRHFPLYSLAKSHFCPTSSDIRR